MPALALTSWSSAARRSRCMSTISLTAFTEISRSCRTVLMRRKPGASEPSMQSGSACSGKARM
eukprot:129706-Rhodomonas_salina.1